jgi:predicted RNase H-related nuclease YkuK (DUF458 family)
MAFELNFKKFDGTVIKDINQYVKDWAAKNPYGDVVIGCDSQEHARYVKYAVAIVMHAKDKYGMGKGAHVIKAVIVDKSHKTPKFARKIENGKINFDTTALQGKLWKEVELTIQAAQMLSNCDLKIKVHVDYNSDDKAASHILYASGIGFANGMGFEAEGKPHAWAATHVADSLCR